jgi:micrococcal nuclease
MMAGIRRLLLCTVLLPLAIAAFAVGASARERLDGPYVATVTRVIDGDTIVVDVPVWLGLAVTTSVRLRGIDTPEVRGDCQRETDLAAQAKERLAHETTPQVRLTNIEGDKYYGRVEADVTTVPDGLNLSDAMLTSGLARPYDGGKRGDWCGLASLSP